jgi:hypothetical protein
LPDALAHTHTHTIAVVAVAGVGDVDDVDGVEDEEVGENLKIWPRGLSLLVQRGLTAFSLWREF